MPNNVVEKKETHRRPVERNGTSSGIDIPSDSDVDTRCDKNREEDDDVVCEERPSSVTHFFEIF